MADYQERGATRSGRRFAELNSAYCRSEAALLNRHHKLEALKAGPFQNTFKLSSGIGDIDQTILRYSTRHPDILGDLRREFINLFKASGESARSGYEVAVTFNAVLTNSDSSSFSIYYGQDYSSTSDHGVGARLRGSRGPILVQSVRDVQNVPTVFDYEAVMHENRLAFQSSNVRIHRIINIVYLIYRFVQGGS